MPFVVLSVVIFGVGIGFLLAPLNLLYRDVSKIISIITTFWFFLTPVMYPAPSGGVAGTLIGGLNPMSPLVEASRSLTFGVGQVNLSGVLMAMALSLLMLLVGATFHRAALPVVLDRAPG